MLFDLRGKRKRVVQVVYVALALIFVIGFVGFGVGVGGGPGGIFDALGIGNGNSSTGSSVYTEQISNAEAQLKKDPKNEHALLNLTRYEFLSGQSELGGVDSTTGQPTLTDAAQSELSNAVDAWGRYAKVAKKPDPALAGQIAFAYSLLSDFAGAARAQEVSANGRPNANSYYQLAIYRYETLNVKAGDQAADKALASAPGSQKASTKKQIDGLKKAARKYVQAQKAANAQSASSGGQSGGQALQNPFQGIAPTSTTPAP